MNRKSIAAFVSTALGIMLFSNPVMPAGSTENDYIRSAFTAAQDAFRATGECIRESKQQCPNAIEAAKNAKRYAESAHSENISERAKTRVKNGIDILEKAIQELSGNWLKEAELRCGYAMVEFDEALKVL